MKQYYVALLTNSNYLHESSKKNMKDQLYGNKLTDFLVMSHNNINNSYHIKYYIPKAF